MEGRPGLCYNLQDDSVRDTRTVSNRSGLLIWIGTQYLSEFFPRDPLPPSYDKPDSVRIEVLVQNHSSIAKLKVVGLVTIKNILIRLSMQSLRSGKEASPTRRGQVKGQTLEKVFRTKRNMVYTNYSPGMSRTTRPATVPASKPSYTLKPKLVSNPGDGEGKRGRTL